MARKRSRAGDGDDTGDDAQPQQPQQQQEQQQQVDRRAQQAEIARRRAAHFANFDAEEGGDAPAEGDDVQTGAGLSARELGPWSSAVQLANARAAAAEQRAGKLAAAAAAATAAGGGEDGDADDDWQPASGGGDGDGARQAAAAAVAAVPRLFDAAARVLAQHIQHVASLWGVPDPIRSELASVVCARRALGPDAALLFADDATTELVLPDCTQLDPAAMQRLLELLLLQKRPEQEQEQEQEQPSGGGGGGGGGSSDDGGEPRSEQRQQQQDEDDEPPPPPRRPCRLQRLELGHCGRGFGNEAAEAAAAAGPLPALEVLRLAGAYRVDDEALLKVLRASPALRELALPSASRLSGPLLAGLPGAAPHLRALDLSGCRGLPGPSLAAALGGSGLPLLERLSLDGIPEVDALVLGAAARGCRRLRELSACMCANVTDDALLVLAAAAASAAASDAGGDGGGGDDGDDNNAAVGLEALALDDCAAITDRGLTALVERLPRPLRLLSVRRAHRVTDEGLVPHARRGALQVLRVAGLHGVTGRTLRALADACRQSLVELDLSFCRGVSEAAVGRLVDACGNGGGALAALRIFGDTQLTARFLNGHRGGERLQVVGQAPVACA